MRIGPKTFERLKAAPAELLDTYNGDIQRAFDALEGELDITIKLKLAKINNDQTKIGYDIAFDQAPKFKDGNVSIVDEKQLDMFDLQMKRAAKSFTDTLHEGDSVQVTGPGIQTPKLVKRNGKMVEE
jgi:hypothetical protein